MNAIWAMVAHSLGNGCPSCGHRVTKAWALNDQRLGIE